MLWKRDQSCAAKDRSATEHPGRDSLPQVELAGRLADYEIELTLAILPAADAGARIIAHTRAPRAV
jgi:hypothetical protein